MQIIALIVVTVAGLWLVGIATLMALRPRTCLDLFEAMSVKLEQSDLRLQIIEQGLRILAGAALVLRAPASKVPLAFEIGGWLLVISSVIILIAPIRWHGAFGKWWVDRLGPTAVRVLAPIPALAGTGLIYSAF